MFLQFSRQKDLKIYLLKKVHWVKFETDLKAVVIFVYKTIKLKNIYYQKGLHFITLSIYIDSKDLLGIMDPDLWSNEYTNKPNLCINKKPTATVWFPRDGHGPLWRTWAEKAMQRFPELPVIDRCHSYQE